MNFEEKKVYLRKAYKLDKVIKSHASELAILRSTLGSIGSNIGGTGHGTRYNGDTADINKLISSIDLERQIKNEIVQMTKTWSAIHDAINGLTDVDEKLVIRYRYIQGFSWDEISLEMNCSRANIYRLHDQGINKIEIKNEN